MSKSIIQNYQFNKTAKTVKIVDHLAIQPEGLLLITNITTGDLIYQFNDAAKGGTFVGNVVTLDYDTSAMSNTDKLQIIYDDVNAPQLVGNARKKFRDGFAVAGSQPNPDVWTTTNTNNDHIITTGGNSSGSAYLRISLNPLKEDTEYTMTSKEVFKLPMRVGFGLSMSQRIAGQEVFIGMVSSDANGNADFSTPTIPDAAITGATLSVTSNVATITLTNHGYTGGDRLSIYGCPDSRLNVGPVVATPLTKDTFTVPIAIANGTYSTVGGFIRYADPLRYAYNGSGYLFENTTVTNASLPFRRNGARFRSVNNTTSSTTATQSNVAAYTDAFNSTGNFEQEMRLEEISFRSFSADSTITPSGLTKYTQGVPDEEPNYHIHIRGRNLKGMTIPVAKIVSIAKTGTTTATVTTDVPHGLTVADWVQIYGVRDSTNFPGLTAATAIASVPSTTTFTIIIGGAVTASSVGGVVWRVQGSVVAPGAYNQAIQSISRTSNIMTVIGSVTWATPIPGEYIYLYGMDAAAAYEGAYKVLRVATTTLELESVGADFASINTGGTGIKMTDVRIHFTRVLDYSRLVTEIVGGRGNTTDVNNAVPVAITATTQLGVTATQTTGINTTQWSAAGWGGLVVTDIAGAAITATATSATVAPGAVNNIGTYAHSFNIPVTAVSGTNPTLDVGIEESPDNGTNWIRVYDFQRITATGMYTSPLIRAQYGSRYRYVRTVSGTTPSFTMSLNRVQFSSTPPLIRQFFDRTIVLTTINSVTPTYNVDGAEEVMVYFNIGAATSAPQIQLEGSETGISTDWYAIGSPITAVASSTVTQLNEQCRPKFIRARVSTVGVGVTAGYVSLKAIGR